MIDDLRRRFSRAVDALREPLPLRTGSMPPVPPLPATIELVVAPDYERATQLAALGIVDAVSEPALVVPDVRPVGMPNPYAVIALLRAIHARPALVSLALPGTASGRWGRRWKNLAGRVGVSVEPLGDEGWVRVDYAALDTALEEIDIPAELHESGSVIAITTVSGPHGCAPLWQETLHPNSAMRTRLGGDVLAAEVTAAIDATWVVTGIADTQRIAAVTRDRVAAQLVALALWRVHEDASGIEAEGPWEAASVQRMVELGIGARGAADLEIRLTVADNASAEPVHRLAELLGCRLALA